MLAYQATDSYSEVQSGWLARPLTMVDSVKSWLAASTLSWFWSWTDQWQGFGLKARWRGLEATLELSLRIAVAGWVSCWVGGPVKMVKQGTYHWFLLYFLHIDCDHGGLGWARHLRQLFLGEGVWGQLTLMTHGGRSRIETRTRLSFLNSPFLKNPALSLTILLDTRGGRGLCFD